MSIDIEWVKAALRKALDPPDQPTQTQVSEICRLTYLEDARKEIQRMIDRRLKHPDSYGSPEVFHTLIVMQNCLSKASSDFVDFCIGQMQLVVALTHYERSDNPIEREMAERVRSSAKSLSKILLDPPRLADKRRAVSAATASTAAPPPVNSRHVPLPTPPSSPAKNRMSITPPVALRSALPTPDPTPPKPFSILKTDHKMKGNIQKRKQDVIPSASVLLLKKEDVAMMTFRSGKDGLEMILDALNDLLRSEQFKRHPDELVKALTCVHHCLYWGSASFVMHCREIKAEFDVLRQHSIAQVRGHADAVVNLLTDRSRLQEERQSRASLMPPNIAYAPLQEPKHIESVRESHGRITVLEPVYDISKSVTKTETRPFAGGGYSDVWKGMYMTGSGKETVAIKFLRRLSKIPQERLQKRLNRELYVWRGLLHENICPFYGIFFDTNDDVGMVSPFYPNGNALEYVERNPNINPVKMLQKIADGVVYLHSKKIVHGDIKCANVMISKDGTPMLIDFGLAQVIDGFAEVTGYTTSNLASSLRWSAPELVVGDSSVSLKSEKSDVYAFASTCIEIMTLECPYRGLNEPQILNRIIKGQIPERPSMDVKWSPTDELWKFLTTCWRHEPQDRPNIVAVRRKLAEFYDGVATETTLSPARHPHFTSLA